MTENDSNSFEMAFSEPLLAFSTPQYIKELESKFRESIILFPELHPKKVVFELTTEDVARAKIHDFRKNQDVLGLLINPINNIYYYFIGHELTHFVQQNRNIPFGEQECDVWTIVRSDVFADISPSYIDMPMKLRDYWDDYKVEVRKLFIESIEISKTNTNYIQWLERELFIKGRNN